jgi:hypothetical protein
MTSIEPYIRHMILCKDATAEPGTAGSMNIHGMLSAITRQPDDSFPLRYPLVCAYIEFTSGRGEGKVRLEISHAGTEAVIFRSKTYKVVLGNNPLAVNTLRFRIKNCTFPEEGLYWVDLYWNNKSVRREALLAR